MSYSSVTFYAFANPSTSGSTSLIAAVGGSRILVLQICVITSAANNIFFQSNGTTTISASFPLASNGGFVLPYSELGWMQTNIGESLTVTLGSSAQTAIQIVYCLSSN